MATLFLSYKLEDRELAERLQSELELLGHTIRVDTNAVLVGSGWRDSLMRALVESDAVVALITERSLESPFVISEIGAARALGQTERKMALLPVIIGDMPIPQFIQDLYVIRLGDPDLKVLRLGASEIDKAVRAHLAQIEDTGGSGLKLFISHRHKDEEIVSALVDTGGGGPKLFISHRHKDEEIVSALVDVLRSAFVIDQADIRCTSVRPFRLPVGERTPDRLKRELKGAQAVVGILTPDTRESSYVLFELGGAWAQNILTCPMLARGASIADVPDPIQDINPLSLEDERDCHQFLDDLEGATTLKRQARVGGDVAERIRKLVEAARKK